MEKRVRGSNIFCSVIIRLQGRLSSGEEGKGTEILGKKIKFFKKTRVGKNIKYQGTLYTPVLKGAQFEHKKHGFVHISLKHSCTINIVLELETKVNK